MLSIGGCSALQPAFVLYESYNITGGMQMQQLVMA